MFKELRKKKKTIATILALLASQSFAQYEIKKYTINSGGGKMAGGNYEMNSSIGQVDASNTQAGGNYSLNGGFWHKTNNAPLTEIIFTNGFE